MWSLTLTQQFNPSDLLGIADSRFSQHCTVGFEAGGVCSPGIERNSVTNNRSGLDTRELCRSLIKLALQSMSGVPFIHQERPKIQCVFPGVCLWIPGDVLAIEPSTPELAAVHSIPVKNDRPCISPPPWEDCEAFSLSTWKLPATEITVIVMDVSTVPTT